MYKNNSRNSSKSRGCSPLQLNHKSDNFGMKNLSSTVGYYSYTKR